MTFSEIVKDHGYDTDLLESAKQTALHYENFGTGFVMVHTVATGEDVVTAMAVGDVYPRPMWRYIRSMLKNRQRPIVIQYVRNFDKLFKASQRYGAIALDDGIVIFPV